MAQRPFEFGDQIKNARIADDHRVLDIHDVGLAPLLHGLVNQECADATNQGDKNGVSHFLRPRNSDPSHIRIRVSPAACQ